MQFTEENQESCDLFIATGDGTTEKKVLSGLIKFYPANRAICFPKTPRGRKTGLSVFRLLNETKMKEEQYLFIIDKEYWGLSGEKDVRKRLEDMNMREIEISCMLDAEFAKLYLIECKRGSKPITAYLAISGKERRIEENIAYLIELQYKEKIETEKGIIRAYLREKGLENIEQLIERSHKKNIKKAFPHFTTILSELNG